MAVCSFGGALVRGGSCRLAVSLLLVLSCYFSGILFQGYGRGVFVVDWLWLFILRNIGVLQFTGGGGFGSTA